VASCFLVNDVFVLSEVVATLPVAEVAQRLNQPVSRVHQLVRDGQLLSFRREGEVVVPADFLDEEDAVVKGLSGTIAEDDSLPGTPVASLRAGRHREVKRRAQAMAF
jgi:hypothetical protein